MTFSSIKHFPSSLRSVAFFSSLLKPDSCCCLFHHPSTLALNPCGDKKNFSLILLSTLWTTCRSFLPVLILLKICLKHSPIWNFLVLIVVFFFIPSTPPTQTQRLAMEHKKVSEESASGISLRRGPSWYNAMVDEFVVAHRSGAAERGNGVGSSE